MDGTAQPEGEGGAVEPGGEPEGEGGAVEPEVEADPARAEAYALARQMQEAAAAAAEEAPPR